MLSSTGSGHFIRNICELTLDFHLEHFNWWWFDILMTLTWNKCSIQSIREESAHEKKGLLIFFTGLCNFLGNKAKGTISKRVFQENKARQIFQKTYISYPLIRTCAYQGVRSFRFSETLACFVFLKYPFWDSPLCLITDDLWNCKVSQFSFFPKPLTRLMKLLYGHHSLLCDNRLTVFYWVRVVVGGTWSEKRDIVSFTEKNEVNRSKMFVSFRLFRWNWKLNLWGLLKPSDVIRKNGLTFRVE